MTDFLNNWKDNQDYFIYLDLMASLSGLFSDSDSPYLNYRVTENLFCKCFNAENLSRSDTAYDAKLNFTGVGIKTFGLKNNNTSTEKIAEFNRIADVLGKYKGDDLAYQVALARNERIELGKRNYAIKDGFYHIVGRVSNGLIVFNTPYKLINLDKIKSVEDTGKALHFQDDTDYYTYNYSKSTLFKRFEVTPDNIEIPVNILDDPYELLRDLMMSRRESMNIDLKNGVYIKKYLTIGINYVVLPLFSTRQAERIVPEKSGLNQWNASGRSRGANEVYIPIPQALNNAYPNFFPDRDTVFDLELPNGIKLSAKVCQENRKALMSNPNSDLGKWILRDVLNLPEYELATIQLLDRLGFDSVIVYKRSINEYKIDICREIRYSKDIYND